MTRKIFLAGFGLIFCFGGSPLSAQDSDPRQREQRRSEIRGRISELTRELSDLQSEQMRMSTLLINSLPRRNMFFGGPMALTFGGNRARLGVVVQTRRDVAVDTLGALIENLTDDAPARNAGLRPGDIIVEFDGEELVGRYPPANDRESEPAIKLIDLVGDHEVGDTVEVVYRRGREIRSVEVVLDGALRNSVSYSFTTGGPREMAFISLEVDGSEAPHIERGFSGGPDIFTTLRLVGEFAEMELVSLNEDLESYFGTDDGVLVVSAPENDLGLQGGDVILRIGDREVDDPSRVFRILGSYEPGENVTFEVMRHQSTQTVNGKIPERTHGVYRMRTQRR